MAERGKKKIDTWECKKDGRTVSIEVFMKRETCAGEGGSAKTARFIAECKELGLNFVNTDINELQTEIFAKIKTLLSVEYSPFFIVETKGRAWPDAHAIKAGGTSFGQATAEASIKINAILLSEPQPNGKRLSKTQASASPREFNDRLGEGSGNFDPNMRALIPDTEDNRAGLRRIVEGFAELNEKLTALCNADKIEKNLQIIGAAGGKFLTAGSPE